MLKQTHSAIIQTPPGLSTSHPADPELDSNSNSSFFLMLNSWSLQVMAEAPGFLPARWEIRTELRLFGFQLDPAKAVVS